MGRLPCGEKRLIVPFSGTEKHVPGAEPAARVEISDQIFNRRGAISVPRIEPLDQEPTRKKVVIPALRKTACRKGFRTMSRSQVTMTQSPSSASFGIHSS